MWGKKPKIFEDEPTIVEATHSEPVVREVVNVQKAAASVIAAQMTIMGSINSSGDISIDGIVLSLIHI